MAANSIPQISALGYIAIFGTVSVLPSSVVYGLSYTLSDKTFTKVVNVINKIFSYMCIIFIPIILGIIVWWCFTTGIVDVGLF